MHKNAVVSIVATLALFTTLGCSDNGGNATGPTDDGTPNTPPNDSTMIESGRVSVAAHKIEAGNVAIDVVRQGLTAAATALDKIVIENEEHKNATGTIAGRFRVEPDGTVRMFLEESVAIENADGSELVSSFVGSVFGKQWNFPAPGDTCMVFAKFQIKDSP